MRKNIFLRFVFSGQGFVSDGTYLTRARYDLGSVTGIRAINAYTWHNSGRVSQTLWVYGAKGTEGGMNLNPAANGGSPIPAVGTVDPATVGWTLLGLVDTVPSSNAQIGSSFQSIGDTYPYILFDIAGANLNAFGGYYGELDVSLPEPATFSILGLVGVFGLSRRSIRK